jgi:hypothetical protein
LRVLRRGFIGNPRGNLECGSAQPSLFSNTICVNRMKIQKRVY